MRDYFDRLARQIASGEYVPCQFCSAALSVEQLRGQYQMCDQHWEGFCRLRWPDRYPNPGADPRGDMLRPDGRIVDAQEAAE